MNNFMKFLTGCLTGIVLGVVGVLWQQQINEEVKKREDEVASVKWRQNHFLLSEENLYNELVAQGIDFPEIVKAQAVLETGHFKSHVCVDKNNLFGLRNKNGTYMSFSHWTFSVAAYKKYIQKYNHSPDDYYKYLDELGYAEDPDYITKLKQIVNKQ